MKNKIFYTVFLQTTSKRMKVMHRLIKNIIMSKILILLSISNTFAAQNNQQISIGLVQRIYLSGDYYFFRLQGPDTCAKYPNGYNEYYFFRTSNPFAKSYYALILSAAYSKNPITIQVKTDCSTNGHKEINYIFQDFN